ncbi:sugar phosphorylase [Spirochaeta cellobiosiphila]|uniref:sugar phosphorylase n=1 Tax=Spirochaeta cellobiosiphila TaxID=504483 RepID=UPI000425DF98|nr:sugar phosphorylase [Spirochaeta cellobiosiphila]
MKSKIYQEIEYIYGKGQAEGLVERVRKVLQKWEPSLQTINKESESSLAVTEEDSVLITYGDQFQSSGHKPLEVLMDFMTDQYKDILSTIHILPFSPWSSDDGFSVIDYREVKKEWGQWSHVEQLSQSFDLMFDLVLNHCSSESSWFQDFLQQKIPYDEYFICVDPKTDLSKVVRPRALPLLSPYHTASGTKYLWTTFSKDQVDLNFANPNVLIEFIDIILLYISKGARIIRLDAIAYLWKEVGTSCIHHPKTHSFVRLMRAILDKVAPGVLILTETNVPHKENISYFGNGTNEAHMVYQFSLPPLTLHAFITGNTGFLQKWAMSLPQPDGKKTYFNFLASHDGIGVTPAKGILDEEELSKVYKAVMERGGLISYKDTTNGPIPYELNINYFDAVSEKELDKSQRSAKFLTSQAIMLAMAGIPGIYVHSLLGSENDHEGVSQSGINRRINRAKFKMKDLNKELKQKGSLRSLISEGYKTLLTARRREISFHPKSLQKILRTNNSVFAFVRGRGDSSILCIHNVTGNYTNLLIKKSDVPDFRGSGYNIITQKKQELVEKKQEWEFDLEPYDVIWMRFTP